MRMNSTFIATNSPKYSIKLDLKMELLIGRIFLQSVEKYICKYSHYLNQVYSHLINMQLLMQSSF